MARVREWLNSLEHYGYWSQAMIDQECGFRSPQARNARRQAVNRLKREGLIEPHPRKPGQYKLVCKEVDEVDWQNAEDVPVDILLPFDMQEYVEIFERSIIVVAGTSNVGKTAYLYHFILKNMNHHLIDLYNTETSPGQMRRRMNRIAQQMGVEIPYPAPWRTLERYEDFESVIHPDRISVIDYLEVTEDFYMVGATIKRIWRRLNKGLVVIALQKAEGFKTRDGRVLTRDLAIGGQFTKHKAQLYLSFDSTNNPNLVRGKVVKAKVWHKINPNGMTFTFEIDRWAIKEDTFSWDDEIF
jgi:hypothetical protein